MLASGSDDITIKIWNLSNNTLVATDGTIKLWDVDTYSTITSLRGHTDVVYALSVYSHDDKPYLASGSWDNSIKIWSLEDHTLIRTIDEGDAWIRSLTVVNIDGHHTLASGDFDGKIKRSISCLIISSSEGTSF